MVLWLHKIGGYKQWIHSINTVYMNKYCYVAIMVREAGNFFFSRVLYIYCMQPMAAGCIIAGSAAVSLMQCPPVTSTRVLILPTLEG